MKKKTSYEYNGEFDNNVDEFDDANVSNDAFSEEVSSISELEDRISSSGTLSKSTKTKIISVIVAAIVLLGGITFVFFQIFKKDNYLSKVSSFNGTFGKEILDVSAFNSKFGDKKYQYSDEYIVKLTPFYKDGERTYYNGKDADIKKALKLKEQRELETFEYFFSIAKSQYDSGDNSYWTKDKNETFKDIKKYALNMVNRYYVPYIVADVLDIKLTDEDYTTIKADIDEEISTIGGRESFDSQASANHLSYDLYCFLKTSEYLEQKIYSEFEKIEVSEADIHAYFNQKYSLVKHVLVLKTDNSDSTKDEATVEKENAELKAKAQEVLSKAKAGEDFDKLIEEYNEDPGMEENSLGYFVTDDETYVQEFQDASLKLKENEISDIVETKYGYHIIKRVDPTKFYTENAEQLKSEFYSMKYSSIIKDIMEHFEKNTKVSNYFDKIGPDYFDKKDENNSK